MKGFSILRQSLFLTLHANLHSNGTGTPVVYSSFIRLSMSSCVVMPILQVLASQDLSEDKLFRIPYRCVLEIIV